jgi:hypothetical protein
MQPTDVISLLVVALSNAAIAGRPADLRPEAEEALKLDLTGSKPQFAAVRFHPKEGGAKVIEDWLRERRDAGARSVRLIKGEMQEPPGGLPPGVTPAVLAGFQGNSPLLLLVVFEKHCELWAPRFVVPPDTDLKVTDLLRFLGRCENAAAVRDGLSQRIPNIPRAQGESPWQAIVRNLPEELPTVLTRALTETLAAPGASLNDKQAWDELYTSRKQQRSPAFEFHSVARADGVPPRVEIGEQSLKLKTELERIAAFAASRNLAQWAGHFRACAQFLVAPPGDQPTDPILKLFAQCGWPKESVRLLESAMRGWVFGGRGSWNDVGLLQDAEYNQLSTSLLAEIHAAMIAASCSEPQAAPST